MPSGLSGAPGPPPGMTERVHAERVLVVAPHYDDEVLGCGGLLRQLARSGARIEVVFLSDGSGGSEAVGDRAAYARRRRSEAGAALRLLGVSSHRELGLPDGALAGHRAELTAALTAALVEVAPDLVLAPSPLERSADHRAAFAALHEALAPLRRGDALGRTLRATTVLLYEVNQPAYPDLLVDVGGELRALRRAMGRYASQEERHGYGAAALGLRRFRTLTLGAEVAAAEGYRRLALGDFTTRSPAQLLAHLGGPAELRLEATGPSISIVVRTRDRPVRLRQALTSLAANRYGALEVVLVNDGGRPPTLAAGDYPFELTRADHEEPRGRAAAAQAGVEAAGGDWIGFLDDDDLLAPEHLTTLAGAVGAADVRVAYTDAAVGVYELDPDGGEPGWRLVERRLPYSRDFDPALLLVDNYIPFNTLLVERRLLAEAGPFDASLPCFEDWDLLIRLAALAPFHHLPRVTCEYRHFRGGADQALGGDGAARPDFLALKARVLAKHAGRLTPELLAAAVATLRREAVEADDHGARRELARLHAVALAQRARLDASPWARLASWWTGR